MIRATRRVLTDNMPVNLRRLRNQSALQSIRATYSKSRILMGMDCVVAMAGELMPSSMVVRWLKAALLSNPLTLLSLDAVILHKPDCTTRRTDRVTGKSGRAGARCTDSRTSQEVVQHNCV